MVSARGLSPGSQPKCGSPILFRLAWESQYHRVEISLILQLPIGHRLRVILPKIAESFSRTPHEGLYLLPLVFVLVGTGSRGSLNIKF